MKRCNRFLIFYEVYYELLSPRVLVFSLILESYYIMIIIVLFNV